MANSSDDNAMMKSIMATHGLENRGFFVYPILKIIKIIVESPDVVGRNDLLDGSIINDLQGRNVREALANKINSISNILENCWGNNQDVQETILEIFKAVSELSWEAKGVIVLAAFAVNYGEFLLIQELRSVNDSIANTIAFLVQMPRINDSTLNLTAMSNLTKDLLQFITYIYEHKPFKSEEITTEPHIPTAIYWMVRSVVISQLRISKFSESGFSEYIPSDADDWELSTVASKIIQLRYKLDHFKYLAEKNRVKEMYQKLIILFEETHDDNQEILKALIGGHTLHNGQTNTAVGTNSLAKKSVFLYISGLNPSNVEVSALMKMYNQRKSPNESNYDIIWLPIVDTRNETNRKYFENIRQNMPWLSLPWYPPLEVHVIDYINNFWSFKEEKRSIIVALNPKGKVVHTNALYMIAIWGSKVLDYSMKEEELLESLMEESWRLLELLVDGIEPPITQWISEGKLVCLYGGEDIEWIKEFTTTVKSVSQKGQFPAIEMVYMGTIIKRKLEQINNIILSENISHTLSESKLFRFRLQCLWHIIAQKGKSAHADIIKEVLMFRSFACSGRGWAIIINNNKNGEMAKAMGDTMMQCLSEFDDWKSEVEKKGFVGALDEQIHKIHTIKGCNKVLIPAADIGILKTMSCFECGRMMEAFTTFLCCGDESGL